MDDLITALELVRPYCTDYQLAYPTGCEHDALYLSVNAEQLPEEILAALELLSFKPNDEFGGALTSFRFGEC